MQYEKLTEYLPYAALVAGVLLLLWGQRSKVKEFVKKFLPKPSSSECEMCPTDRFTTFYALRSWCAENYHDEAIKALDGKVLPVIVLSEQEK